MSTKLKTVKGSDSEVARALDAEINGLIGAGVELGFKLIEMRTSGLYRKLPEFDDSATFQTYIESKHSLSQVYANKMMEAAAVHDTLSGDNKTIVLLSQNGTMPLSHLNEIGRIANFRYDKAEGSDGRQHRVIAGIKNPVLVRNAFKWSEEYYEDYRARQAKDGKRVGPKTTTLIRNALCKRDFYGQAGVPTPVTAPLKPQDHICKAAMNLRAKLDKYSRDGGDAAGFIIQDKWPKILRKSVRSQLDETRREINEWLKALAD